jgi:hypothetical protein
VENEPAPMREADKQSHDDAEKPTEHQKKGDNIDNLKPRGRVRLLGGRDFPIVGSDGILTRWRHRQE